MGETADVRCRDARRLPSDALERLRRNAVSLVESGIPQKYVALDLGVSRRSVNEWVRAYREAGEESFRSAQRGRRPGEQLALCATSQERILRIVVAGPPDRAGLPCRLWTRRAVVGLIDREFGITLGAATIGRYLQRWGIDTTSDPCWQGDPQMAGMPGPGSLEGAVPVRVVWSRPRLPIGTGRAHVVQACTDRGALKFLASMRPFDLEGLEDLRHRLRMELARDVRIVVCAWPTGQYELLDGWLSGDPSLVTRAGRPEATSPTTESLSLRRR